MSLNSIDDGSICPALVTDYSIWPLYPPHDRRAGVYIIGQVELDRYVVVPGRLLEPVREIISYFDGTHSLQWIQEHFYLQHQRQVDVTSIFVRLAEAGLISSPSGHTVRKSDIELMTLPIANVGIKWVSECLGRAIRLSAFAVTIASLCVIVCGSSVYFEGIFNHASVFNGRHVNTVNSSLLVGILLFVSVLIHEMSHGYVAAYYGLHPRRLRVALYLGFIPIVYLRMGGLYTLAPHRRIVVWLAGVYSNITIASCAVLLLHYHVLSTSLEPVARAVALGNYTLGISNLFPFLPTDGYYILATLCRTYNVRLNAWTLLATLLRRRSYSGSILSGVYMAFSLGTLLWFILARLSAAVAQRRSLLLQSLVAAVVVLPFVMGFWARSHRLPPRLLGCVRCVAVLAGLYFYGVWAALVRIVKMVSIHPPSGHWGLNGDLDAVLVRLLLLMMLINALLLVVRLTRSSSMPKLLRWWMVASGTISCSIAATAIVDHGHNITAVLLSVPIVVIVAALYWIYDRKRLASDSGPSPTTRMLLLVILLSPQVPMFCWLLGQCGFVTVASG